MEAIIKLVSTPEWWFSAVLISIVTSIFATYAKDWFSKFLSFGSERIKRRIIKRKIERQTKINCFLENPVLLSIAYQEITQLLCFFIFFILVSIVYPIYNSILMNIPETSTVPILVNMQLAENVRKEISALISFGSAVLAIIIEMVVIAKIKDCKKAKRILKHQALENLNKKGVLNLMP